MALFLPITVAADCLTWLLCPYKQDVTDPASRYLAIGDMPIRDLEIVWKETEVAGREDELGQSVVCIESTNISKAQIEGQARSVGCTVPSPSEVPDLMISPFETRFDPGTGKIEFNNGTNNGRQKMPIRVPNVIRDEIRGRP